MIKHNVLSSALLLAACCVAGEPGSIRAKLLSGKDRQAAPEFSLKDASGAAATIAEYRGKVVLLDFWATWCGGCKHEIPWFEESAKTYKDKGLVVVGVSLDEDGWTSLKPFLTQHPIAYRIVLGSEATAKRYDINGMPDTFLIDQQGRIAAAYRAGVVDQNDLDANIQKLLSSGAKP